MASKVKVKRCGHSECALNTLQCCGCEDNRPIAQFYHCYIDGLGYTTGNENQTRFKDYCPPCRDQFERLRPGMKRCSCGVVACDLTTQNCCACLDHRPLQETSYRYEGRRKMRVTCRWNFYCESCKLRLTAPPVPKKSRNSKIKAVSGNDTDSLSERIANSASKATFETNVPFASPRQPEPVPNGANVGVLKAGHLTSSEFPVATSEKEILFEFVDLEDYEIVSPAEVACTDQTTSRFGTCVKMGKSIAGLFSWR